MAKFIKPMVVSGRVRPMRESEFQFSSAQFGERALFDSVASEHVRRAGTEIEFWSVDQQHMNIDPLYGETVEAKWIGPFRLVGHMEWPDYPPETREEGLKYTASTGCWVARSEFEAANAPVPGEGDVIRIWRVPFFDVTTAAAGEVVPGSEYAFTIVDVDDDGHLFDNPDFVGYRLDLRRNSEFTPERRVQHP